MHALVCMGLIVIFPLLFQNVTGHCSNDSLSITQVVTNVQSILCGADFSRTSPLLFPSGQCSNDSSSAVTDIRNVICGTTSSDRELHVKASVLLTYHSMTSQAATATDTDEGIRMHMQNISEMLRGLLRNYFRVVS